MTAHDAHAGSDPRASAGSCSRSKASRNFPVQRGLLAAYVAQVKAVDGVTFALGAGETLCLVGESGCGKSTVGRLILRLIEPTGGSVGLDGDRRDEARPRGDAPVAQAHADGLPGPLCLAQPAADAPARSSASRWRISGCRRRQSARSGSPTVRAGGPAPRGHGPVSLRVLRRPAPAPRHGPRAGGQPPLIIADEPVSALDVSVQAQVLNLLTDLQKELHLAYLFISHDLGVVEHIGHRVAVMYLGRIVEIASKDDLFAQPLHPYSQALIAAAPIPDPRAKRDRIVIEGDVPSPIPAVRLSLPHTLPVRLRPLPDRGTGAARCRWRPPVFMPPRSMGPLWPWIRQSALGRARSRAAIGLPAPRHPETSYWIYRRQMKRPGGTFLRTLESFRSLMIGLLDNALRCGDVLCA